MELKTELMNLVSVSWEFMTSWEVQKESIFQKILTYHLLPTSSLLLSKDLSDISVIITGCTNGIGYHTAREFAMGGAHVTMACRNVEAAYMIASRWREEVNNTRVLNVEVMELDLLSFSSVQRFSDRWNRLAKPLHILINNAGFFQDRGKPKFSTKGIEPHIHVNHIAPALLTLLLLPSLQKAPSARIINVNSVVHHCGVVEPEYWNSQSEEQKFNNMKAYGSSKLAHIMFLKFLANKLLEHKSSIQCIAVHPGAVCTNLNAMARRKPFFIFDALQGARSIIFCATDQSVEDNLVEGFAYYSCSCRPGKMSRKAEETDACLEVWQKTLEILELEDDYVSHSLY